MPEGEESFEAALRALRLDHRNRALPGLAACYLMTLALLLLPLWQPQWWLVLGMMPLMGMLQYRIVISGHEAVHRTLCWPEWLNETLGVFGQALVGVNFASYRVQHIEHHRSKEVGDDPDGHIYGPIVSARKGVRRWMVYLLGTFVEIAIKVVQKGVGSVGTGRVPRRDVETARTSWRHTAYVLLAQVALLTWCWYATGRITGYLEVWIAPLFLIAVFLNRSRILVEHGLPLLLKKENPGRGLATVDIVPPRWQRWIFAPFLFNYHCCHHLYMTVPHYNLPRLRALLRSHEVQGYSEVSGSYTSVIRTLMSS